MTITLSADQLAWIEARIASGEFSSIEDGVRTCVDLAIVGNASIELDDLAWAKPLVDEALAEVERGETVSLEALKVSMRKAVEGSRG